MFSQNVYHFTSPTKFDYFLFETVAFKKKISHLKNFRITLRVRKLLLLIPTDPAIQEALDQLDSLGRKV